ncbi:MAG: TatD family deoxyribonuclease [Ruminococcaceae bacterium]|nr:TatD family deoxyribonuclease [Oscillospiraceae bacterium]
MAPLIFDTHAHYDDEKFEKIRESLIADLFNEKNVGIIVNVGTNLCTNDFSLHLAEKYENIYAACGFHPHELLDIADEAYAINKLREQLAHPKCLALGEIGLDYHYDQEYAPLQQKWMRLQMSLAEKLDMPVIIHDREAHGPCFDIIKEFPKVKGVFHSFSGSIELAKELVKRGWYVSFSGVVTFKNASRLAEVVKSVPIDRLLLETDCPYLAPEPMRGTVNNSANIMYTARKIAELKELSYEDVLRICFENAKRFYKI